VDDERKITIIIAVAAIFVDERRLSKRNFCSVQKCKTKAIKYSERAFVKPTPAIK